MIFVIYRSNHVAKFYTHDSNIDSGFKSDVRRILYNSNWHVDHNFIEVQSPYEADISINLSSDKSLDKYHNDTTKTYSDGRQIRYSITTQSKKQKPNIYINANNWLYGVKESGLSLEEYRKYIINHEFGHGLGYDHQMCNKYTSVNGICPVMYQSTIGCPTGYKCGNTPLQCDRDMRISGAYVSQYN